MMEKVDYISGTEDAYSDSNRMHRVQVSGPAREGEKTFGVLVDLFFDDKGRNTSSSRLEWFPKSLCRLERIENPNYLPIYFLYAPEWLLMKNNVKYKKEE